MTFRGGINKIMQRLWKSRIPLKLKVSVSRIDRRQVLLLGRKNGK